MAYSFTNDTYTTTSNTLGYNDYNDADSGTSSSMTYSQDHVWAAWTSETKTADAVVTVEYQVIQDQVWRLWSSDYTYESEGGKVSYINGMSTWRIPKRTTEQIRAEKAQKEINRIWRDLLVKEQEEEKRLAEVTAQELLEELIEDRELAHYKEHGELLVRGRKYDYIIRKQGGVIRVAKDKVHSLCIHLRNQYKYPRSDNVIALKLAIDADERKFNKTANASSVSSKEKVQEWRDKVNRLKRVA